MQLDLLQPPGLQVKPEPSRTEPRLWVRRLVIWSEPGVVLRDLPLRRGLNVIWSPDPSDRGARPDAVADALGPPGHGAGKTLVCRLLRYCLGESSFASDVQRQKIASAFREGRVGAEVVLHGVVWTVVRSIGVLARDVAIRGESLESTESNENAPLGMTAFLDAVQSQLITEEVAVLVAEDPRRAWLTALAWLTRDQECRFDEVTDWRSPTSDTGVPTRRRLSATRTLEALRALLGAISAKEHELQANVAQLDQQREEAARSAERHRWAADRLIAQIARSLNLRRKDLPEATLVIDALRTAATAHLRRVAAVSGGADPSQLPSLEEDYEVARSARERIERDLEITAAAIERESKLADRVASEMPGLSYEVGEAEAPSCPVCEVPIDRALAEGCKLSHKLRDLESLRARRDRTAESLTQAKKNVDEHNARRVHLVEKLTPATERATEAKRLVDAVRRARDHRTEAWASAHRIRAEVEQVREHLEAEIAATAQVTRRATAIVKKREHVGHERDERGRVFIRLSEFFGMIVRTLLGPEATGRVKLDGNGLHLTVELGGDRSTPAIESVKVLAFDLAAMCLSVEGGAHVPAFLVHDSPREADLGLSVYHRLFQLAIDLEQFGGAPMFQYIVTTTTRPPDNVCKGEWLRLTLEGAPGEKRLLGRDL